ncbi:MAG: hypothetical protein LC135_04835 [Phycisphaerae bacterium]|jgi:hypothetical protein|nr:hypothetical protein [Phycisphaerae bacterium]MCZ2399180.1 hypothetical protein [Phycisphaerae bacterium]
MRSFGSLALRAGVLVVGLGLLGGCAAKRAAVPLGEWRGEGTAVVLEQRKEEGGYSLAKGHRGRYPTWLRIERVADAPRERLRLEIVSEKGDVQMKDREKVHIIAVLEEAWRSEDDKAVLYRLVEMGGTTDGTEPKPDREALGPLWASCMVRNGAQVLQIHYMEGFEDTFAFHGDRLEKHGSFVSDQDAGWVRWTERLRRRG